MEKEMEVEELQKENEQLKQKIATIQNDLLNKIEEEKRRKEYKESGVPEKFWNESYDTYEETALNADVDYALVTYGYRTTEEIKNSCVCTNLVDTPEELLDFIRKAI